MKSEHTIQEAADYFNLPKATLLYWEKEGLIHFDRIAGNNYRKLTAHTIFEIENVMHLRNLGIPINKIKEAPLMSLEEKYEMYKKAINEADRQVQLLKKLKHSAQKQLLQIQETDSLRLHPYHSESPRFQYLIAHSQDTVSLEVIDTGRFVILMENPEHEVYTETSIWEGADTQGILWEHPGENTMWKTFLLDIVVRDGERKMKDLQKHLSALHEMGYRTGTLVAHYLSEAMEGGTFHIYFKAYVEVSPH